MEKEVAVPEGMLKAVYEKFRSGQFSIEMHELDAILEVALFWLSENPIVPTRDQIARVIQETAAIKYEDHSEPSARPSDFTLDMQIALSTEWQRRALLAEPEKVSA
jgi:hypothetical protein